MKITIGRARKLEKACAREAQAILKAFERDPNVRFSAHANNPAVKERLTAASTEAMRQLDDVLTLYRTQSRIRAMIGQANAEHRLNETLAERAVYIEGAQKTLDSYLKLTAQTTDRYADDPVNGEHDAEQILVQMAGIRQRLSTVTAGNVTENVTVRKLSSDNLLAIREQRAAIERRLLDLDDEIAKINTNTAITLPDDLVTVLQRHKIIG